MGRPLGLSGYRVVPRRARKPGAEGQGRARRALFRMPRLPEPDGVGQARRERLARPRQLHARHDALFPRQRAAVHRPERGRRDRLHQSSVRRGLDPAAVAGRHSCLQEPRAVVRRRGDEDRLRAIRDAEPQSLRLERGPRQGRQLRGALLRDGEPDRAPQSHDRRGRGIPRAASRHRRDPFRGAGAGRQHLADSAGFEQARTLGPANESDRRISGHVSARQGRRHRRRREAHRCASTIRAACGPPARR